MDFKFPVFSECEILVIGDLMLDQYWIGNATRISPEAPVPVVNIEKSDYRPGGAGNVALNLAKLGCKTTLLGLLGNDKDSEILDQIFSKNKIINHSIKINSHRTIKKLRVLSKDQQLIRLDLENSFSDLDPNILEERLHKLLYTSDSGLGIKIIILSDYLKGTLQRPREIIEYANKKNISVIVDPKRDNFADYFGASVITPNFKEFVKMVGPCPSDDILAEKARKVLIENNINHLVITRGEKGLTIISQKTQEIVNIKSESKEVYDVTGAGDTVISVIACCLAKGIHIDQACKLANTAASIVVSKVGTSFVTPQELYKAYITNNTPKTGIVNKTELKYIVALCKAMGEKIVMVNGCYDLLHYGHIDFFKRAKAFGDKLIVAVNSDQSVRQLKRSDRPVNKLENRMLMLENLSLVDWVVEFSEITPGNIIDFVEPNVLVKGNENFNTIQDIPENEGVEKVLKNGGEVHLLPRTDGVSSTILAKSYELL